MGIFDSFRNRPAANMAESPSEEVSPVQERGNRSADSTPRHNEAEDPDRYIASSLNDPLLGDTRDSLLVLANYLEPRGTDRNTLTVDQRTKLLTKFGFQLPTTPAENIRFLETLKSRHEALTQLVEAGVFRPGVEVSVLRTSGAVENTWTTQGIDYQGLIVTINTKGDIRRNEPAEFLRLNPEFANSSPEEIEEPASSAPEPEPADVVGMPKREEKLELSRIQQRLSGVIQNLERLNNHNYPDSDAQQLSPSNEDELSELYNTFKLAKPTTPEEKATLREKLELRLRELRQVIDSPHFQDGVEIRVRRSNGNLETGWKIYGVSDDGRIMTFREGDGIRPNKPSELIELNPELFSSAVTAVDEPDDSN